MSEKQAKRMRRLEAHEVEQDKRLTDLEVCVTKIRLDQKKRDRFEDAVHGVRRQNAAEDYSARREAMDRARRAERRAKFWQLAAIIVLLLLAITAATISAGEPESMADTAVVTTAEVQSPCIYILSPEQL